MQRSALSDDCVIVELVSSTRFKMLDLLRVHEPPFASLEALRDWAVYMRHTDSVLVPSSEEEFAVGLTALDMAIAEGELPTPMGVDLLVLA